MPTHAHRLPDAVAPFAEAVPPTERAAAGPMHRFDAGYMAWPVRPEVLQDFIHDCGGPGQGLDGVAAKSNRARRAAAPKLMVVSGPIGGRLFKPAGPVPLPLFD